MKELDRALLSADVAQFLAQGGSVTQLKASSKKAPRRSPRKITVTRNKQEEEYSTFIAELKEHSK